MKSPLLRFIAVGLVAGLVLLFSSCAKKKPVLHVYIWSDYLAEGLVEEFAAANNCEVIVDNYDSNEVLHAKLKGGATGYDLVFPSSYIVRMMVEDGLLQKLNHDRIPNIKNLDPIFVGSVSVDKKMVYSIPYMTGATGIAYRTDEVEDFVPSWQMFARSDLAGRMTLLDDHREVLGAALRVLGHSMNSTDEAAIEAAADLVIEWKRNIAQFASESNKAGIASKEFYLVQAWGGDVQQIIDENEDPNIAFALPQEGFAMWEDTMAIPTGADNVDLAEKFINFLHDPVIAARNIEFNYYLCPNWASYRHLSEEVLQNPIVIIPPELLKKGEQIKDIGDDLAKYTAAWDRVKATQ
ncbi:polyamine ABC transporter substrate-binding protein [Synoicihabitans lomoniglobus]|uniref:Spermidine/putrescine ABC transporter substrate-binding protein n=1 Tax=Synoicihabitans lomoniglobus TaxID=2909285 RepID=A0AAF0CRT5_9BACT|nr:spermidine/putrescine ABC transporter substrate-binding protein [Opitutaceae bacterium LMO-M01]WED66905.1 spermidine/putrescine ABC transporter substrate-binding protein [Opitutaceae bacterium LMO-M01]